MRGIGEVIQEFGQEISGAAASADMEGHSLNQIDVVGIGQAAIRRTDEAIQGAVHRTGQALQDGVVRAGVAVGFYPEEVVELLGDMSRFTERQLVYYWQNPALLGRDAAIAYASYKAAPYALKGLAGFVDFARRFNPNRMGFGEVLGIGAAVPAVGAMAGALD